jgi:hypothetical protein
MRMCKAVCKMAFGDSDEGSRKLSHGVPEAKGVID